MLLICTFADIDTDTLLKNELVTLDEALKTANYAALLAMNTISVVISVSISSPLYGWNLTFAPCSCHWWNLGTLQEKQRKHIDAVHDDMKELRVSEVVNVSWPDLLFAIVITYFIISWTFVFCS